MSCIRQMVASAALYNVYIVGQKIRLRDQKGRDPGEDPWVDPQQVWKTPSTLRCYEADYARRSLRASSPIWTSEASLARTLKRGAEETRACNDLS